ncbi:MAG: glucokinase [Oculatellaceae cyanobacterium Prado106]|jgi:glucokinase|nr:glucokinase [Oculatellaceae cyanobacterium Prado106]
MTQILAGDIGGTKTILRWVEAQPQANGTDLTTRYEEQFVSREFADLVPMIRQFYAAAHQKTGETPAPERACFAIAGPVSRNTSSLTNLSWYLEADRLEQDLAIAQVNLINDFAAIGYGIAGLKPEDLHTLQEIEPQSDAPIAVLGAGTGLGECFLIRHQGKAQVFPTEGGHSDFAPRSELEFQLLKYLREKHGIGRISVERVVSGQGIVAIYQFLRDRQSATESAEIQAAIRTWEQEAGRSEKSVDPAAVIAIAAAEERDYLSERTMQMFAEAYGAEAGNLALKLLPYGGLYIAGGIAAKNLPLIESGGFLRAMTDKGRMRSLMEQIPVHVILNPQVGLIGAALYAVQ